MIAFLIYYHLFKLHRSAPLYGFLVFFTSTWFAYVQDGPIWPRASEIDRGFCRKNWWTNLLFINNIVNADEPVNEPNKNAISTI